MALESLRAVVYGMALGYAMGAPDAHHFSAGIGAIDSPGGPKAQWISESLDRFDTSLDDWKQNALVLGWAYHDDMSALHREASRAHLFMGGVSSNEAATVAGALLVAQAVSGAHVQDYAQRVVESTDGMSEVLDAAFYRLGHVLAWNDEVGAMAHIGRVGGDECLVALACYCVMRFPTEFAAALRRAVHFDGDSGRLGYLVGGMMGAKLGLRGIPGAWYEQCDSSPQLDAIVRSLSRLKGERL